MNKPGKIIITTSLVTLWLLARYNSAIAATLKWEKTINQTEQLQPIKEQTWKELSENISQQVDSIMVKKYFLEPWFLDSNELKDFNTIWNRSINSDLRPFLWNMIRDSYELSKTHLERTIKIIRLLDQNLRSSDKSKATDLGKRAWGEIIKDQSTLDLVKLYVDYIASELRLRDVTKRSLAVTEENKKITDLLNWLKAMEKVFKENQKK